MLDISCYGASLVDVTVLGLVGGAPGGETPRVADSSAAGAGRFFHNVLVAASGKTLESRRRRLWSHFLLPLLQPRPEILDNKPLKANQTSEAIEKASVLATQGEPATSRFHIANSRAERQRSEEKLP